MTHHRALPWNPRNTLEKPKSHPRGVYIPDDITELAAIREVPEDRFWSDLTRMAAGERPVLYTHGYNIDFERGCNRASLFQQSLGLEGRFLLFSWPSDGAVLNYTRDEADLYWSVAPLQRTLAGMSRRLGPAGFDVVAHSLGTRGVFLALVQMANGKPARRPIIDHLVFVAPDIDAGIFEQYLPKILPLASTITVYVSGNDSPLLLSRSVHGYPRLGEAGTHLDALRGIEVIDVTEIGVRHATGHLYHLYHRVAARDLTQLLIDGRPAAERRNLRQTGENHWRLLPGAQPGAE